MAQSKPIFKLYNPFQPAGDQPEAISALVSGLNRGMKKQTLLGATGTGKTFTMANVIAEYNKPTLVIAHNKTLAAQLAQEFRLFFPESAVHYFVSYYDYYQPEAYMPASDTYIEKDAQINKEIDRLRHATTQALLTRPDVIIVASVSCIYGLGSPEEYEKVNLKLELGMKLDRLTLMKKLIEIHFERTNADLNPGTFRSIGSRVEFMPVSETIMYQVEFGGGKVSKITKVDPISSQIIKEEDNLFIFPAKHFITEDTKKKKALVEIKKELNLQLKKFEKEKKLLEAERIKRRTNYDLAMIKEVGYCNGIENYSRHLSGKKEGEPPETLLSYFPKTGFLTIIDESHVTLPQLNGMYAGDASRKNTLVEYGFRLPSAKDNRPLKYGEFQERIGPVIYTSATPGKYEIEESKKECEQTCPVRSTLSCGVVEQIIRPTGLLDPEILIRPVKGQIDNLIGEIRERAVIKERVLVTTLTKKMAEDLSDYLDKIGILVRYIHSDIDALERVEILRDLRLGDFDVLVGVNLLREGLDLPEVSLVAIIDADKEGFLRSERSLMQTAGRTARNVNGKVIMYADIVTDSMRKMINETNRRRKLQTEYNEEHNISPKTIYKSMEEILASTSIADVRKKEAKETFSFSKVAEPVLKYMSNDQKEDLIIQLNEQMHQAAKDLEFERAAALRDEVNRLKKMLKSN